MLAVILFFGFLVRLYRFDNPVADWHAWRQADTSAISKIFSQEGFDILRPKYFDISNIQSGLDNPMGYRFVEFPILNILQASLFKIIGVFSLEQWGRLVSIVSSLFSATFLYLFIKKYYGETQGLLTSFFFLFLPFSIYYSRTILPDVMMTTAILGGIYFFDKWTETSLKFKVQSVKLPIRQAQGRQLKSKNYSYYFLAILFTALALLLKPFAIFFVLPMVYIAWKGFGKSMLWQWQLWVFAIVSIAPVLWWRQWMLQYPEGIPANSWLFNEGGIRFRPAFFRWMLFERLIKLILGYAGVTLFVLGFLKQKKEDTLLPFSFALSSILYVVVIARGNVQHDYYQIVLIPSIAIFLARGTTFLYYFLKIRKEFRLLIIGLFIGVSFLFSWNLVKDYFNINNRAMVEAGKKADRVLAKDAKVIALYNGDTTLLYYVNRRGWPAFQESIEKLIEKGATHLVIVSPTKNDFEGFGRMYEHVVSSEAYLILRLK